jgi:hypothetical protein
MNRVRVVRKEYEREIIATGGKTVWGHFKGGEKALQMVKRAGDGEGAGIRPGEDRGKEQ